MKIKITSNYLKYETKVEIDKQELKKLSVTLLNDINLFLRSNSTFMCINLSFNKSIV